MVDEVSDARWEGHRKRGTALPFVDKAGDKKATKAELVVARYLGCEWVEDANGKDPGWDMVHHGWRVEVKSTDPGNNYLLVKKWLPRNAHIYVLIIGDKPTGWAWKDRVEVSPLKDFGYTHLDAHGQEQPDISFCIDQRDDGALRPMFTLYSIASRNAVD